MGAVRQKIKGWLLDEEVQLKSQLVEEHLLQVPPGGDGRGDSSDVSLPPVVAGEAVRTSPGILQDVEMYANVSGGGGGGGGTTTASDAVQDEGRPDEGRPDEGRPDEREGGGGVLAFGCAFDSVASGVRTRGGRDFLRALVDGPVRDVPTLSARRAALEGLISRTRERAPPPPPSSPTAADVARMEGDVLWAFRDADEASAALYEMAYFRPWFARPLNRSPVALALNNAYHMVVSPAMGVLSPIVYFLVPYFVLRYKAGQVVEWLRTNVDMPAIDLPTLTFSSYLSIMYESFVSSEVTRMLPSSLHWLKYVSCGMTLLFYFQSVFNSFEISRALRVVCRSLDARMRGVAGFFAHAAAAVKALWRDDLGAAFFPDVQPPAADALDRCTADPHARAGPGLVAFVKTFGTSLARYRAFDRAAHRVILRAYYALDALGSLCAVVGDGRRGWCLAQWSDEAPTRLGLRGLWHPCLRPAAAVANDVVLGAAAVPPEDGTTDCGGGGGSAPSLLLTGPNAGGKSTLIKAVLLGVLLAQSVGVVPCRGSAVLAPFAFVSSQINVPDVKGKRSLFEEEMFRARANLEQLRSMQGQPGQRALIVIDEIFSSTNPVEGIAGAYSVARNLAAHEGAACLISTHYTYLGRLQRDTGGRLRNVQMPVIDAPPGQGAKGGGFIYPYRLRRGVCRQYIALELLGLDGFDPGVVDEALRIKRALLSCAAPNRGSPPSPSPSPSSPPGEEGKEEAEEEKEIQGTHT